jgi:hypothetical protein
MIEGQLIARMGASLIRGPNFCRPRTFLGMDERIFSRTFPRTVDGLRIAVAGLPPSMPVGLGESMEFAAKSIADLRAFDEFLLPHRVDRW